jgi:hypothetical protein
LVRRLDSFPRPRCATLGAALSTKGSSRFHHLVRQLPVQTQPLARQQLHIAQGRQTRRPARQRHSRHALNANLRFFRRQIQKSSVRLPNFVVSFLMMQLLENLLRWITLHSHGSPLRLGLNVRFELRQMKDADQSFAGLLCEVVRVV